MVKPAVKLQMKLFESDFSFSKRMKRIFNDLDITTVNDLTGIPLKQFVFFRGFKKQCKAELIAFIEFEQIYSLFEGFEDWKNDEFV